MRRKWDARTKAKVVLEGLTGDNVTEVCRKHNIRAGLFYKWRNHFLDRCHEVFEPDTAPPTDSDLAKENERLKQLVGKLTLRLDEAGPLR